MSTGTAIIPTIPPGVILFNNLSTIIDTDNGELVCVENGAANINPSSDGENVILCVITGGTGDFNGASGYLQRFGTSAGFTSLNVTGEGKYRGKIVTP